MTSVVKHVTGEPTIILEFDDSTDEQSVISAYSRSLELANSMAGAVYRVVDVRSAPSTYPLIVETIQQLVQGLAGAATIPQMAISFVGQPNMAYQDVSFFTSPDDALAEARSKFAEILVSL